MAKIVSALGVRVIAFDPYIQKADGGIDLVDLDTLLKESDFISIHCPLNESTRHLIGEKAFRKMKKKPLIVNTSRGPIIDEKALAEALKEGLVSGAGLDVLEKEPPDPASPLLKMENVICLSPYRILLRGIDQGAEPKDGGERCRRTSGEMAKICR